MGTRAENIEKLTQMLKELGGGSDVLLSDAIDSESGVSDGVAATPKAVKTAYDKAVSTVNVTAGTGIDITDKVVSLSSVGSGGKSGPASNTSPSLGGTFVVPYITYDEYGRVSTAVDRVITLPTVSNAPSATKLQTARTISVKWAGSTGSSSSGTSSFTFDGTANKTATINYYYPSVCYDPYCSSDCS